MLKEAWQAIIHLGTDRPSTYPTETATINCSCGARLELSRDELIATYGDKPLGEIEAQMRTECKSPATCNLTFFEASVPSFYR